MSVDNFYIWKRYILLNRSFVTTYIILTGHNRSNTDNMIVTIDQLPQYSLNHQK